MFDLSGKVAMVTGSSKGLGEAAAVALAGAGADLAICGRNTGDIQRVVDKIKDMGRDAAGFVLDVTSGEKVREGVDAILTRFGRVDILFSGDVGTGVAPGAGKTIVWDFAADNPDVFLPNVAVRVTADDGS